MKSVFEVAHWFLEKESMNHKKLQKLCYYAQAWSYALNNEPLFDGDFEAWVHGPVHRELWDKFKAYGYSDISFDDCPTVKITINKKTDTFLNNIWDTYGEFTGFQLESLTHEERPWIEARGDIPYYQPSTKVISRKTMRDYYLSQYSGEGIGE